MNSLFPLESISATWLSPGTTAFAIDMTLALLFGLGLFLLLLPCLPRDPASPPPRKKKAIKKCQMQGRRRRSRNSKKSSTLKACRDCLKYLDETQSLVSLMQSLLGSLPDEGSSHQPSKQDPPDEECRRAPAEARQLHGEHAEPPPPAALAPLSASASLPCVTSSVSPGPATSSSHAGSTSSLPAAAAQPPQPVPPEPRPLALSLPPACPPDPVACPLPPTCSSEPLPGCAPHLSQWDARLLPPGAAVTWSSVLQQHLPCSPIPAAPWWQVAAEAWGLATPAQGKSQNLQLSCLPTGASPPGDLRSPQMVASDPSSLSSDSQKLLGVKVTKKVEIQIWKEKENTESFLKQMGPGNPFSSLTSVLNSLSAGQDKSNPLPFGDMKDKSQQLLGPQKFSYPTALGDHFQQKYSQLFWGLPSLHSESLVATAWISQNSVLLPSFFFNKISSVGPDQLQDKMSPVFPQPQPLSCLEPQPPPLILSVPQFQPQPLGPFHLQSSFQVPSAPPLITDLEASQKKPPSPDPTEIQHPEGPFFGEQLGTGWALPTVAQRSQEVYSVLTPSLSRDDWAVSMLPEDLPVSPELRCQLQRHIQKWLIRHRWDLPRRIQESLELMQSRDHLARTCHPKEGHCPKRPCLSTGESSKDLPKVRFQLGKDVGKNLGHILGKAPKDPHRALESFPVKVQEENSVESERSLMMPVTGDSRDDLSKNQDLENILQDHLGIKSGQINTGVIPRNVRQSWLCMDKPSTSHTQMASIHLASSKSWEACISTFRKLPFLDPHTQQTLEAHVTRFWAKHKWSLPLKILKPVNAFKMKRSLPSGLLQLTYPPSGTCTSGSSSEVAEFPDQTPRVCLTEKAITLESGNKLECPLLVSSRAGEEVQGALKEVPSSLAHGPSDGTGCKSGQPLQAPACSLEDRTCRSTTALEAEKGSPDAQKPPRLCATQDLGEVHLQKEMATKFQQKVEIKMARQPDVCITERDSSMQSLLSPSVSRRPLWSSPVSDVLASQVLGDTKHQDSWRSQSKVFSRAHRDEDGSWPCPGTHTERTKEPGISKLNQVGELEDTTENNSCQNLLEKTQACSEGKEKSQRSLGHFFQRIFSKKQIKERVDAPPICELEVPDAQSQRGTPCSPCADPNVAEARELMRAVGHMLQKKLTYQQEQAASRWNQQGPGVPVSRFACCHQPTCCSEQRTLLGYAAAPKGHTFPTRHRQLRGRKPSKVVRFTEQQSPTPLPLSLPHEARSLISSTQCGATRPPASGQHHHCPRHCLYRTGCISGQPGTFSLVFSNRKTCLQGKM